MNKIYLGAKYYRYISDTELEVVRVICDKDKNSIKCSVNNSMIRKRLSLNELDSEYIRLAPDGFVYVNIAKVQDIEDVIVTLYRSSDINENDTIPYCVCRQSITDIFANTINPKYENLICGVSVSKDTIPEGVSMDVMMACDGLLSTVGMCVYIDDTLEQIMKLFKPKEYDTVIYNLFADHVKYKYKDDYKKYMNERYVDGYCKSLKDLMVSCNFMYDLYMGFKVFPLSFSIKSEEINSNLSLKHTIAISNIALKNINNTLVIPYDKFIDLEKIQRDYILVQDLDNKLFIIAYTYSGKYIVPIQDVESKENIEKMSKIHGYSSNDSVKLALRFNQDKYKQ